MPKKISDDYLDRRRAFSPAHSLEPALQEKVDAYYREHSNARASDCLPFLTNLTSHPVIATPNDSAMTPTDSRIFYDEDKRPFRYERGCRAYLNPDGSTSLRRYFFDPNRFPNCRTFFERHNPLPPDFVIFEAPRIELIGSAEGIKERVAKVVFSQEQAKEILSALDEEMPLLWDHQGYYINWHHVTAYLFGKSLWILTKEDKEASPDELRLLFLEAVDQQRKKYERLKHKFSGLAGERIKDRRESIPEGVRNFCLEAR